MSRRPTPQPAAARPKISKATEAHPAAAPSPIPAVTPEAAPAAPTLVPFSTRIPADLRERYERMRFTTRKTVQQLVTEALTAYANKHD